MKEIPFDPEFIDDPWIFDTIPGLESDDQLPEEFVEWIRDAVETLPDDQRDVVELVIWGQMTKVEIAAELGRSRQSVHDVLNRAFKNLRKELSWLEGV